MDTTTCDICAAGGATPDLETGTGRLRGHLCTRCKILVVKLASDPVNADWVTHCQACSCLYEGTLDQCPSGLGHKVGWLDMNSPDVRAFSVVASAARGLEESHS